ncbi:MAG TPA: TonB-dependent receptor [Pyrinomonadaceae bacterium]|jgi:hypothetical protein
MRVFPLRRFSTAFRSALISVLLLCGAQSAFGQAQSNAADLRGFVRDPQGSVVPGATVTARNPSIGITRTATTNEEGLYQLTNLPPSTYEISVEATNFKRAVIPEVVLTVGQSADLDVPLELGAIGETVTVTGATTEVVETSRSAVANTIEEVRIDNLPINQRDATGFALTISTVGRDNGRPIGPAPTSGINIGGQRGRSTLVQVDGADNTDNSINASRSTISQEAVQEFQVVTNSYAPEFGRTTGGVVNVVTKSGTNDVRGNIFGFLRHRSYQARNPFAPIEDPPFTRAQYGATLGGPLVKDKMFVFLAFEQRRRQETGFFTSDVIADLTDSVTIGAPFLPFSQTFSRISRAQGDFIRAALASGNPARIAPAISYAFTASSGGTTALNGFNPLVSLGSGTPVPAGQVIGSRFLATGQPVPFNTVNAQGLPAAFRPLLQLQRVFPISEDTTFSSVRLDHSINERNQFTFRAGYNPSEITGIQNESQNQSLGQNDVSRTGIQKLRDWAVVTSVTSTLSNSVVNEARFNFGSRNAQFLSQNNDSVAVNIVGTAFFGRELFSPVTRQETRFQFTDFVNVIAGNHTFKFGGDAAHIGINADFSLNFAGRYNFFGGLVPVPTGAPQITPVQHYGLGIPSSFVQGFGDPRSSLKNIPLAVFAQDSWKIRPNFTLNYGVRYDYEHTDQLQPATFTDPLTGLVLTAADIGAVQDFFGVQQGFPRDKDNIAPRVGLAWDIHNDGKTVLRGAFGIFYDHPLLAIAFNSDIADNVQQQQGAFGPGSPDPLQRINAAQIFQGTVIPGVTPGVATSARYLFGRQRFDDQTFPGFGPALPFPLPVSQDFEYSYAKQGNLSIERQLTKDMSVSASYIFVGSHHLPHPTNFNQVNNNAVRENFRRCFGVDPTATVPAGTSPINNAFGFNLLTCPGATQLIPGVIAVNAAGQRIIQPAAANFFRPAGPNYLFLRSLGISKAVFDSLIGNGLTRPGPVSTFGDVNAQVSDGNSVYHAGNFELKKRFSHNFQFLASYTWSHSIDDSSDLQTLLLPQDANNLRNDRSDSLFDQRHRFVFSGVLTSPEEWRGQGGFRRVFSDFVIAPILELSSGRPFNILTGIDTNNDQTEQTDRPNVAADGTLVLPPFFTSGNLGRNRGITHGYASLDLRVTRAIRLGEHTRLQIIAEGFNLFNRFNEASASPFFTDVNAFNERAPGGRYYSRPTAAFDPRQFQFGLKLNF